MSRILEISVKTINGKIFEFPQIISVDPVKMIAVGVDVVRAFDENQCIVVTRLFLFQHNSDLFGTTAFSTLDGFYKFKKEPACLTINSCCFTINGVKVFG